MTYLLSDQLGSTAITASGSGTKISELRYKAWGEVRYTSGTTPTDYTYTGQYSNMDDFGLMFYNARWYDPTLAHFVQADTVVPDGVQGYDRYAYANNNAVTYNDPSGHCIWDLCIAEGVGLVEVLALTGGAFAIAEFYANNPPPAALSSAFDRLGDQVNAVFAHKKDVGFADYLADKYGLSKEQRRALHDAITKQGLSNEELEREAAEMARLRDKSQKEKQENKDKKETQNNQKKAEIR